MPDTLAQIKDKADTYRKALADALAALDFEELRQDIEEFHKEGGGCAGKISRGPDV